MDSEKTSRLTCRWSYLTEHDAATCREDCLEIFIQPCTKIETYYNFEINALGTVYDAMSLKRRAGGSDHRRWSNWNCEGLEVAVRIKGEFNNPDGEDEYWVLEVAIPFKSLPSLRGTIPEVGDCWKFHLARYDYSVYLPDGVELSSSASFSKVDFHRFEDWNELVFKKISCSGENKETLP